MNFEKSRSPQTNSSENFEDTDESIVLSFEQCQKELEFDLNVQKIIEESEEAELGITSESYFDILLEQYIAELERQNEEFYVSDQVELENTECDCDISGWEEQMNVHGMEMSIDEYELAQEQTIMDTCSI